MPDPMPRPPGPRTVTVVVSLSQCSRSTLLQAADKVGFDDVFEGAHLQVAVTSPLFLSSRAGFSRREICC
jgi:hypothetical protein